LSTKKLILIIQTKKLGWTQMLILIISVISRVKASSGKNSARPPSQQEQAKGGDMCCNPMWEAQVGGSIFEASPRQKYKTLSKNN
jgi:hypothetical protein